MHLRIQVVDAVYVDKKKSDNLLYEFLPHIDPDEASTSQTASVGWLKGPCLRNTEAIQTLHHLLHQKYPLALLPILPWADRSSPEWGTDALLKSMKRRMERYFWRILERDDLKGGEGEAIFYSFFNENTLRSGKVVLTTEETNEKISPRGSSLLDIVTAPLTWLSRSGSKDSIAKLPLHDQLRHSESQEVLSFIESIEKSLNLRKEALLNILTSTIKLSECCQDYSRKLSVGVGRSLSDLTAIHTRHLVTNKAEARITQTSLNQHLSFLDDERIAERNFRQFGDIVNELLHQLSVNLQQAPGQLTATILEVASTQFDEIDTVQGHLSKILSTSLHQYEQCATEKCDREGVLRALEEFPTDEVDQDQITRATMVFERAAEGELRTLNELREKRAVIDGEIDLYWKQSEGEMFVAAVDAVNFISEINRQQIDLLKSWFNNP